jgi:class 3 adenylate cyclase
MTQEAGGEAAVQLAARLIGLVRRAAADNGGCVQLSPGRCRGGRRLAPGAAGLLAGGVVSRDGDYFGQTSEPASRIADYARPWEVLVSADVAEPAKEAASYEPTGDITLRGVIDPASLFRAQIRDTLPAG